MIEIQRFTSETIENIGGIVEPLEYALADVIIPEEYKDFFQNRTEFKLAFDFEVAQENPDSEFVTFGSYIFNSIVDIANFKIKKISLHHPKKVILSSRDLKFNILHV